MIADRGIEEINQRCVRRLIRCKWRASLVAMEIWTWRIHMDTSMGILGVMETAHLSIETVY